MWSLLPRKIQLTIIVTIGVLAAWAFEGACALFTGERGGPLKFISLIVAFLGVGLACLAELAWRPLWRRIPILGRRLFPDLNGKWTGKLHSTWTNPETGKGVGPIDATLTVLQSLFSVHVILRTGESTSCSTRATLERLPDGRCRIWYTYNNDPQAQFRHRSSPHEGMAFIENWPSEAPDRLEGRYYTARKTTGDMIFQRGEVA